MGGEGIKHAWSTIMVSALSCIADHYLPLLFHADINAQQQMKAAIAVGCVMHPLTCIGDKHLLTNDSVEAHSCVDTSSKIH